MREIEFRVWLGDRMDIVSTLHIDELGVNTKGINGAPCYRNYTNSILMQYTGIKDCEGVKIFEGDIVEYSYRSVSGTSWGTAIVKFYDGAFQLEDIDDSDITELLYLAEDLEVIGNIYENPGLLGGKDE